MIDTFSRALIAGMYRDALHAAEDMARIGNFDMARRELASAAEKLTQLESLTTPPERGHSCPMPLGFASRQAPQNRATSLSRRDIR